MLPLVVSAQGPGSIVWDPAASTYDGKAFTRVADGVGVAKLGLPGRDNPAGAGLNLEAAYVFGFATAIPENGNPTLEQMELGASDLTAGTRLELVFDKAPEDHISFVAMLADASEPGNIGVKILSDTRFQITATITDPVMSQTNNPDALDAAFGFIVQVAPADQPFNFRGTTFVTDMVWTDLAPLALTELPQLGDPAEIAGFGVGLAAQGVSASGGTATFTAYIPEALFEAGRAHGIDVDGENCLGYRSYVELTGSDDGFYKLNDPVDEPQAHDSFDVDGDGAADPLWAFQIRNSQWSRQAILFGKVASDPDSPTPVRDDRTWGSVKAAAPR